MNVDESYTSKTIKIWSKGNHWYSFDHYENYREDTFSTIEDAEKAIQRMPLFHTVKMQPGETWEQAYNRTMKEPPGVWTPYTPEEKRDAYEIHEITTITRRLR
jgi:hypothetical protein